MLFNSLNFLIFFPCVIVLYFCLPVKIKNFWLLLSSYYFYMSWNAKYGLLLLGCTAITYGAGIALQKINDTEQSPNQRKRKLILALSLFIIFGCLFIFKYLKFVLSNLQFIASKLGLFGNVPEFSMVLPVGISFFTFQASGYLIDVYRKEIYAERNFFRYALFISFFPQLVAGPIERSKNLLKQLDKTYEFNFERLREGFLLMIWGFFLKIVIADRAALFVNCIYNDFSVHSGALLLLATVLFAFQIYCDFGGYSIIAMGAAKILGLELMDNFNCPYFSKSVQEFWRRWHISLSSWFRDYLYFPMGGSRCSRPRRYVNVMVVFFGSGLWHGSGWSYIIWGGLNGFYQIAGELLRPIRKKLMDLFSINPNSFSHKLFQINITFFLIAFSWIPFCANSFKESLGILKRIVWNFHPGSILGNNLYQYGLDEKNFKLLAASILILLTADLAKYKGMKLREWLVKQDWWFRWLLIVGFILFPFRAVAEK